LKLLKTESAYDKTLFVLGLLLLYVFAAQIITNSMRSH